MSGTQQRQNCSGSGQKTGDLFYGNLYSTTQLRLDGRCPACGRTLPVTETGRMLTHTQASSVPKNKKSNACS